jgi:hypothetical protein
MDKRF